MCPPVACPQQMCCLNSGFMLWMIVAHWQAPQPPDLWWKSVYHSGIRLVMSSMNTSFGRIPSHKDLPSQIEDSRLEFISVLPRLVQPVCHWALLQYASEAWFSLTFWISKSNCRCWYCTCAISDFVSYCVPLGWGEICPIDVRSLNRCASALMWDPSIDVRKRGRSYHSHLLVLLHLSGKDSRHLTPKSWKQLGA